MWKIQLHILPRIKVRVTEGVSLSPMDLIIGSGGRRTHGLGSRSGSLLDWLVDATGGDTVLIEVNNTKETHGYVYAEFWHVFFCMQPL